MGSREPLAGWGQGAFGSGEHIDIGPLTLRVDGDGEWSIGLEEQFGYTPLALATTQLAAEDAARAMVSEMAAALGGSVTWGESEVGE